jgi:hypothetical protein
MLTRNSGFVVISVKVSSLRVLSFIDLSPEVVRFIQLMFGSKLEV